MAYKVLFVTKTHMFGRRMELTWRRTPTPVNIAIAGGNTCVQQHVRWQIPKRDLNFSFYQPNCVTEGFREFAQDVDGGIQPLRQLVVCALRFIEHLDLGSEHGSDGIRRAAGVQLRG